MCTCTPIEILNLFYKQTIYVYPSFTDSFPISSYMTLLNILSQANMRQKKYRSGDMNFIQDLFLKRGHIFLRYSTKLPIVSPRFFDTLIRKVNSFLSNRSEFIRNLAAEQPSLDHE